MEKRQKKILFFEFWNKTPHLETSLELAYNHLLEGDEVHLYYLGNSINYNPRSIRKSLWLKKHYQPELIGIRKLKKFKNFKFYDRIFEINDINYELYKKDKLINFEIDGINIGRAIVGQIAFDKKVSNIEYSANETIINKMIKDTKKLYPFLKSIIANDCFDICYIFNGRFLHYNLVLRLCEKFNRNYLIHERGSSKNKYYLDKHVPHDNIATQKKILESDISSINNTFSFFQNNVNRIEKQWFSYTKHQKKGLSFNWKQDVKKVVFFTSSNDENIAMDHIFWDKAREWKSQEEVINFVYQLSIDKGFQFVVRIHPHLIKKSLRELEVFLANISRVPKNFIILPDSKIDTYQLIKDCDITITAGSTVGVESVFWGKPTITTGSSFYSLLECDNQPTTFNELEENILNSGKLKINRERAILYGNYMSTFGVNYSHYDAQDLYSGFFLGRNLQKSDIQLVTTRAIRKIKRTFRSKII